MLSPACLDGAAAWLTSNGVSLCLLGPLAHARIALPTLGQLAPAINLLINGALIALLLYILLTARKGR